MIPGLVSPDLGARANSINSNLTIRGLNGSSVHAETRQIAASLVSTYVDETPLFANLKMTDIDRVEVLRGPAGGLYRCPVRDSARSECAAAATSVSTEPGLPHNRAEFVGRPRTIGLQLNYSFKEH
jgi:TonB-dependent Receptor Plug Domain